MSRWDATLRQGTVSWRDGEWWADPKALSDLVFDRLLEPSVSISPVGPFFDPVEQPEEALVTVVYLIDGEATFSDPVPDIGGDVPDGAVS